MSADETHTYGGRYIGRHTIDENLKMEATSPILAAPIRKITYMLVTKIAAGR